MLDFDPIYVIYGFIAVSAALFFEGVYLLFFSAASYRKRINRRLSMLQDGGGNRQKVLVELRRERGLTAGGGFRLPVESLNKLILQSGLTLGLPKIVGIGVIAALMAGTGVYWVRGNLIETIGVGVLAGVALPYFALRIKRAMRQGRFAAQFPDAIDMIVRSLRAGHPVPIAVSMVAREMKDPIGSEFGIVVDEITYGADLETAMRNLYFRVGQDDLPLFVTAVAIQGATGGNLGEILESLSAVIRQRFKMRRKIKALAAEGRASALILSSLPIGMFFTVQVVAPDFYGSVWQYDLTKICLALAGGWMLVGNAIMYRMVNFKI
jgi:tight adherence protein B